METTLIGTLGEIRMFAGNFAPKNWAICDNSLLKIHGNHSLFSILGTTYGGDGRTNFALPDLRGRIPIQNTTTGNYTLGEKLGTELEKIDTQQLPAHNHGLTLDDLQLTLTPKAVKDTDNITDEPQGAYYNKSNNNIYSKSGASQGYPSHINNVSYKLNNAGGSKPHLNIQPMLCINYIICINGIMPSRTLEEEYGII